jgi:hypothetical protein
MANSNSINLATSAIEKINTVKKTLRSSAQGCQRILSEIDSLIDPPPKKAVLVDGLQGLSVMQ